MSIKGGGSASQSDLRRVEILGNADASGIAQLQHDFNNLSDVVNGILLYQANAYSVPVGNLLFNGEMGHSVNSWYDAAYVVNDTARECAFFYSHNKPAEAMTFGTADVSTNVLTLTGHGFTTGCTVDLINGGGGLPTGLAVSTTYFVIYLTANTISLATTIGNAQTGTATAITASTGGNGNTIQQQLISTDARTSSTNNELKTIAHTTYNPRYSRWDSSNGQGNLTGTMSIDVLMPQNNVDATTALARVSLIAARLNEYIEIPETASMAAGIWDNTSGQRKFLEGNIGFDAELVGATGAVERRFKILLTSDRGFSLLSSEITIANSPTTLSATNYIAMSWYQQAGQLQVDIYERYDPSGINEYRLVSQVSSATSYIYEGGYLSVVAGYPTATGDTRSATYFTSTTPPDMSDLAINAVAPAWDTVNFPIEVPNNYNKALTTNREWVRIWMTVAANIWITSGVTTDGTDTITIPAGIINTAAFASGGYGTGSSSLYYLLGAEVYDSDDVLLLSTVIADPVSDTSLVLNGAVAAGTDRKLRIVAGGFQGILIDKVHLGYQQNTSYAPNAMDNRTLQPVAAPDGSSQGGTGSGGSGGGINPCVIGSTPIEMSDGEYRRIDACKQLDMWASDGLQPNVLLKLKRSLAKVQVRRVRSANGCEVICTDGESFVTDPSNIGKGTFLSHLRVGDSVLTKIDGRIEQSTISEISSHLGQEWVYTPSLSNTHIFFGGYASKATGFEKVKNMFRSGKRQFVLHNAKPPPFD